MVYNDSPELAEEASVALMARSKEILKDRHRMDAIWENLGFHVATAKLLETGCEVPIGPTAQVYMALVLAANDHVKAQDLLEEALDERA